jgi:hypothetical protein
VQFLWQKHHVFSRQTQPFVGWDEIPAFPLQDMLGFHPSLRVAKLICRHFIHARSEKIQRIFRSA